MQVWKKIHNPSEQEQEALKSGNIFSYGVQASIDSRIPGVSLPAGLLSNSCLWHWNPFLRCAQSFPHLFYLMRFAHIGSDTEELDDVQEAFQYLVILWIKSYFLLHDWEICQDVEFPDSVWFTQQKRRVQKRLDFSTEEEKHPTISLSKCIPRYEGVASKRKFSLLWSPYKEGVTLLPTLVTGRQETWNRVTWISRNQQRLKTVITSKKWIPR